MESLVTVGKISQFNISVLVAQLLMRILQCMYKQQDSGATIVQNQRQMIHRVAQLSVELMYDLAQRFDILTVSDRSKFTVYLQLLLRLHKTMTDGIMLDKQLLASFWKRLIQQALMAYNPECLCNLLLVLQVSAQVNLQQRQRLSEAKSGLSNKAKLFANTLPFSDPLGVGKTEFNFQQKDPHQSGAQ